MYSHQISKKQFDYLLPVYNTTTKRRLFQRIDRGVDKFYFLGTNDEYKDMLNRCAYL